MPTPEIWPIEEPAEFDRWKRLDAALYRRGRPHIFAAMHLNKVSEASELLRRFTAVTGLATLDDRPDEIRVTEVIDRLLARFEVR